MKLISVNDAADRLGLHPSRVRLLCRQGRIKADQIGKTWVIAEREVERFARLPREPGRPRKEVK